MIKAIGINFIFDPVGGLLDKWTGPAGEGPASAADGAKGGRGGRGGGAAAGHRGGAAAAGVPGGLLRCPQHTRPREVCIVRCKIHGDTGCQIHGLG